ncbi:MAG: inositol monophosphatase family protein [Coriobacteriia bacterium]
MLELLEAARSAAMAGAEALRASGCDARAPRTKSTDVDLVTDADIASGVAIVTSLEQSLPGGRYVIEEDSVFEDLEVTRGDLHDPEVWVIDPLDGTTSFVHGYPGYSVSVALLRDGEPVVGVVLDVTADKVFAAAAGLGATLGDEPISVSDASSLSEALLMTGFPYDRGHTLDRQLAVFPVLMRTIHGMRRDGSAALDLCRVACGQADGFWEFGLSPWDTAGGKLILEEAGGIVTDVQGRPWAPVFAAGIVAGNPRIHPLLLDVVRANDPGPLRY